MTTTSPIHGSNSSIPVMAALPAISLDLNATLGATFLGFAFTCMYVPHYQSLDSAVTILPLTCHAGSTALLRFKHGCTSLTTSRTRRYCAALYLSYGNPLNKPSDVKSESNDIRRTLDTLHMVFLTITMYHYLVTEFGNLVGILRPIW